MKKQKIIFKVIALTLSFAMSFSVFAVSFSANATTDWESKITDQLAGVIESASPDKLILVAIQYSDINYDEVNKEVENKTGLTAESIDTDLAMPSEELLNKIGTLSDSTSLSEAELSSIQQGMKSYLAKTEAKREYERELTDQFILSKRSIAKEKYIEKGNTIKNSLKLADADIKFQSQYAPMIITEMTVSEIQATAKKAYVEEIYYYEDITATDCSESDEETRTVQLM